MNLVDFRLDVVHRRHQWRVDATVLFSHIETEDNKERDDNQQKNDTHHQQMVGVGGGGNVCRILLHAPVNTWRTYD